MKKIQVVLILFVFIVLNSCNVDIDSYKKTNKVKQISKINVGVFDGNGAGAVSVIETIEALRIDTGINAYPISASEIQNNGLNKLDVLIFPGGSGSKELNNLGQSGKDKVIAFVKEEGKGVVGICAGAYLLSSTPDYPSIALASSIHLDRKHYNRGRGLVQFVLTDEGKKIFPELENNDLFVQYYDGPVLSQTDSIKTNYNEIATFVTDIHPDNYAPEGITPGKTFSLNENIGKGKLFIIAGHPESTPGMRWMIPRITRWAANTNLVSYNQKWIRPELNTKAILFDKELRKYEKANFWKLFSDNSDEVIEAMNNLYSIRSRPAVRWNIGLLRHYNEDVRKNAAHLLAETEYTFAVKDLKEALKQEKDSSVRKELTNAINRLNF